MCTWQSTFSATLKLSKTRRKSDSRAVRGKTIPRISKIDISLRGIIASRPAPSILPSFDQAALDPRLAWPTPCCEFAVGKKITIVKQQSHFSRTIAQKRPNCVTHHPFSNFLKKKKKRIRPGSRGLCRRPKYADRPFSCATFHSIFLQPRPQHNETGRIPLRNENLRSTLTHFLFLFSFRVLCCAATLRLLLYVVPDLCTCRAEAANADPRAPAGTGVTV